MKIKPTKIKNKKLHYFPNLHSHTGLGSLGDAFGDVDSWVESLRRRGIKHHVITDHGTLTAIPWMYNECKKYGINIYPGMEGYIIPDYDGFRNEEGAIVRYQYSHIVLIAMNEVGWKNLIKINNISWINGRFRGRGRFSYQTLFDNNEGLLCLSACMMGIFAKPYTDYYMGRVTSLPKQKDIYKLVKKFKDVFGDRLYIELMINHYENQPKINKHLYHLIRKFDIEPVITNDCHYPEPDDLFYREAIKEFTYRSSAKSISKETDTDNLGKVTEIPDLYPRSIEEVYDVYKEVGYGNIFPKTIFERGIQNTFNVIDRCSFHMDTSFKLPLFDVKQHSLYKQSKEIQYSADKKENLFIYLIKRGFESKTGKKWPSRSKWKKLLKANLNSSTDSYIERVAFEYNVIKNAGFIDYFLIVEDIVSYCTNTLKRLYGKGRGSVSGSIISWCLGITKDDPIANGLYFERFMNPGRIKGELPDIDLDFPSDVRDKLKLYITNKYGSSYVINIGNIGVVKIKSAIQKMASVQDFVIDDNSYNYHAIQKITHSIPGSLAGAPIETLEDAVNVCKSDEKGSFYKFYTRHKEWLETKVNKILMHPISYGRHAAGIIISSIPIDDCIPIRIETVGKHEIIVSQWRDKDLIKLGFLKLDLLGLSTLNQIEYAVALIKKHHKNIVLPTMENVNKSDKKVYDMISRGATKGIFQFNSNMFRHYFRELKPRKFEHLYTTTALLRPGPLAVGAPKRYVELENGMAEPSYIHPDTKPALVRTNGLVIFQEQAMKLCTDIAGFNLTEADNFRSVVGKKKRDQMPAQKKKFIKGAIKNGYSKEIAKKIFSEIEAFASYSFNLAHALSYSGISYYQAWIKAYFLIEYWASKLQFANLQVDSPNSIWAYRFDALNDNIRIAPIDVNTCSNRVTVSYKTGRLRWRLDAIKNVGSLAAYIIGKCKPYSDPIDLIKKTKEYYKDFKVKNNLTSNFPVTKQVIKSLITVGAFDSCNSDRHQLAIEYLKFVYTKSKWEKIKGNILEGRNVYIDDKTSDFTKSEAQDINWVLDLRDPYYAMLEQHKLLGFADKAYWRVFRTMVPKLPKGVTALHLDKVMIGGSVNVYGILKKFKYLKTRNDKDMITGIISEYDGDIRFVVFPKDLTDDLRMIFTKLYEGGYVYARGEIINDRYTGKKQVNLKSIINIKWALNMEKVIGKQGKGDIW